VAVILVPDPLSLLLIRRAERGGDPWSGHVAMPGGRREPGDVDLVATAIRETMEEVAIVLDRSQLLGALGDVAPVSPVLPPIAVRPYVFGLPGRPTAGLSSEVAASSWEPVETLLRTGARGDHVLTVAGVRRHFPAYQTGVGTLWGMTERILASFIPALAGARTNS
jgi:8-oxo-dGTP pyrophosphatase MutT (NUDIX family)